MRIYVDTSVIGGCLDDEFMDESRSLFEMAKKGDVTLPISDIVMDELELAPAAVQLVLESVPAESFEWVTQTEETWRLRNAYLEANVVGPAQFNDAHHVALATVFRADMIVSWNFTHIVHFDKMRRFNAVNLSEGYPPLEIHSPREVV
ncbi:MAG: PIN domain-containing protein [Planctomycetota bacterium]